MSIAERLYIIYNLAHSGEKPWTHLNSPTLFPKEKKATNCISNSSKSPTSVWDFMFFPPAESPHTEDEIYYVVSGKAQIKVADEDRAVQSGSIVYVVKNIEHRFHSIEEELTVIVFFAPAEYTNL
jgi:mannose-6-phosphate isomerase-like protein (cupin superfamily)